MNSDKTIDAPSASPIAGSRVNSPKFAYQELGVTDLQAQLQSGRLTSRTLVLAYLSRIDNHDRRGPRLNAVIETNPDAVSIAAELDRERRGGLLRSALHGTAVLIKDNLASADRMQTTAGSLALEGPPAPRDSAVVARLRAAGGILLGKANLSEWAHFRSPHAVSGWSARGGLVRNPYALDRSACGSSSGTAAGVAASFATVGVGTETDGSIVLPAAACGLVGIKPTVGLISRRGMVPVSSSHDTAGPLARSVTDAVAVLTALAGADSQDPITLTAPAEARDLDYSAFLEADGLRGARLGILRSAWTGHPATDAVFERRLAQLVEHGAVLMDHIHIKEPPELALAQKQVWLTEFKEQLNTYLAEYAPQAPVKSLQDLIDFNRRHATRELQFFGQEFFEYAQRQGDLNDPNYQAALAACHQIARVDGLDRAFTQYEVDALIAPTAAPAWLSDLVLGDRPGPCVSRLPAVAGYPHITLPMGEVAGLPVNLSLIGPAWSEAKLIRYAYAIEQAFNARIVPSFARTSVTVP